MSPRQPAPPKRRAANAGRADGRPQAEAGPPGPPPAAGEPWAEAWFEQGRADRAMRAWRGVEAQHIVSTMRLVDALDEQAVLEQLLEASKPPLPAPPAGRAQPHDLLATPFRYRPRHGSRFRAAGSRGIWYGAETLRAACAEVAYWRWRFLVDSEGLQAQELLTQHSFFQARVQGPSIDLTAPPWVAARDAWTHPLNYAATQALAAAAAARGLQWIRYESVRDPGAACAAVLQVQALQALEPEAPQTWHCRTTARLVMLVHGAERFSWAFEPPSATGAARGPAPTPPGA